MKESLNIKINHWSLLKFALPTMIANIFMSVYMTVDGIFVANCVNTNALSAVNIVMPYRVISARREQPRRTQHQALCD